MVIKIKTSQGWRIVNTNGVTPHIGANGNWFIGNMDTGQSSKGDALKFSDLTQKEKEELRGEPGPQGNTGSSIDYPFELVNNLIDGGFDKALTAEQGKILNLAIQKTAKGKESILKLLVNKGVAVTIAEGQFDKNTSFDLLEPIDVSEAYAISSKGILGFAFYSNYDCSVRNFISYIPFSLNSSIDIPKEAVMAVGCRNSHTSNYVEVKLTGYSIQRKQSINILNSKAPSLSDINNLVYDATFDSVLISISERKNQIIDINGLGATINGYVIYSEDGNAIGNYNKVFTKDNHFEITITGGVAKLLICLNKPNGYQNCININDIEINSKDIDNIKKVESKICVQNKLGINPTGAYVKNEEYSSTALFRVNGELLIPKIKDITSNYWVALYTKLPSGLLNFIRLVPYEEFKESDTLGYFSILINKETNYAAITFKGKINEKTLIVKNQEDNNLLINVDNLYICNFIKKNPWGEMDINIDVHQDCLIVPTEKGKEVHISLNNRKAKLGGYIYYTGTVDANHVYDRIYHKVDSNGSIIIRVPSVVQNLVLVFERNAGDVDYYDDMEITLVEEANTESSIIYPKTLYMYNFRSIIGRDIYLYKDALYPIRYPMTNMEIRTLDLSRDIDNYSEKAFKFTATGEDDIKLEAYDDHEKLIASKTIHIHSREMPSEKLANVNSLDVIFMGDSLTQFNRNQIGAEFVRMLNTEDSSPRKDGKAVFLPTLNLTKGKIKTYGEMIGVDGVHWQTVKNVYCAMKNKRSAEIPGWHENPFYNYESSQPDELDEKGWNKRVDFKWYFEKVVGVGRYPKLIYLTMGPNDMAEEYKWSVGHAKEQAQNVAEFCKRIKKACDTIAGGDSGVVIKMMTHQTYPLTQMHWYNYPIGRQRLLWHQMYDEYDRLFKELGLTYVELIDCGSRFDWEVGYDFEDTNYNPRYDGVNDNHIKEACHMNLVGALNYADCIIDDFICDERFD